MTFAYPWMLALPVAYILMLLRSTDSSKAVRYPSLSVLAESLRSWRTALRTPTLNLLLFASVCLLSIGAARPHKTTILDQTEKTRNIMLVVDVSKSMAGVDFPESYGYVSRMEGVRAVVSQYVRERSGEAIGLVIFGEHAYLQSPLTTDVTLVERLVLQLEPGMAGDGTAIGDGLGVGLKRLRDVTGDTKAIILLTDGANNAGSISPLKAAKVARDVGIKIHTIGLGTGEATVRQQILGGFTAPAMAEYDEATLRQIADTTGGIFFNAKSLSELSKVYAQIDKLDESEREVPRKPVVEELFFPFALAGTALYLIAIILGLTIFMRIP